MFVAQDTDATVEQPLGKSKAHTLILESSLLDVKPDEIVFFPRFMWTCNRQIDMRLNLKSWKKDWMIELPRKTPKKKKSSPPASSVTAGKILPEQLLEALGA